MAIQRIIIDDDGDFWFENANGEYIYYSSVWSADPRRSPYMARIADASFLSVLHGLTAGEIEQSHGVRERYKRRVNVRRE